MLEERISVTGYLTANKMNKIHYKHINLQILLNECMGGNSASALDWLTQRTSGLEKPAATRKGCPLQNGPKSE